MVYSIVHDGIVKAIKWASFVGKMTVKLFNLTVRDSITVPRIKANLRTNYNLLSLASSDTVRDIQMGLFRGQRSGEFGPFDCLRQ